MTSAVLSEVFDLELPLKIDTIVAQVFGIACFDVSL